MFVDTLNLPDGRAFTDTTRQFGTNIIRGGRNMFVIGVWQLSQHVGTGDNMCAPLTGMEKKILDQPWMLPAISVSKHFQSCRTVMILCLAMRIG